MTSLASLARRRDVRRVKADYDETVQGLWGETSGGALRAAKGKLVERMAKDLVKVAWTVRGGNGSRLGFERRKYPIPLARDYLARIPDRRIREHLERNIDDYRYGLSCDVQCYVDDRFVLAIECKAYTEVAMLKRIMVDASLLHGEFPSLRFLLFQLESQLGGDYSQLASPPTGSPSAHTVMSNFEVFVDVITLLAGERKVKRPIHKQEFFKELQASSLAAAVGRIGRLLPEP